MVRSLGYSKSRQKIPSGPSLYVPIGADLLCGKTAKIQRIVEREDFELPAPGIYGEWDEEWGVPEYLFFVNEAPLKNGTFCGNYVDDPHGCVFASYHVLSQESRLQLKAWQAAKANREEEQEESEEDEDDEGTHCLSPI